LNIPLAFWQRPAFPVGTIVDPDTIARVAETDMIEAGTLLFAKLCVRTLNATDWVDALAAAIQRDPSLHLETWARSHRLSPETVSRGFKRVFGVAPRRFRAEIRAQRALRAMLDGRDPLSQVAVAEGFSDQSHMTRAVVALTGKTPRTWRNAGKQAAVRAAVG
jgi:AraC-like DNA-binding protein